MRQRDSKGSRKKCVIDIIKNKERKQRNKGTKKQRKRKWEICLFAALFTEGPGWGSFENIQ